MDEAIPGIYRLSYEKDDPTNNNNLIFRSQEYYLSNKVWLKPGISLYSHIRHH